MRLATATATAECLGGELSRIIPGAQLAPQRLGPEPGLELLLLRDSGASLKLDSETVLRIMDNPLYWVFCWASGRVLARYILQNPALVHGRRIVDFGCGSGVVAIAAALAGAREVVACDLDPIAQAATGHNAALNDVTLTRIDDFEAIDGAIDLILAADVLYDAANLVWLRRFTRRAGEVFLADSRVRDLRVAGYQPVASFESTTLPDLDESREYNRVTLYRGSSPAAGLPVG
jgi:predicted nicotinamide N-methyase